jgi:hypothetical protein
VTISAADGEKHIVKENELNQEFSQMLFARSGAIVRIDVSVSRNQLYTGS